MGRWHPAFVDVTAKGNTKQNGIDQIIRHFGIKLEETMPSATEEMTSACCAMPVSV